MFTCVEARHYKCLKKVNVQLGSLNILIGPNASGKSTLLDVFGFLRDTLAEDVEEAIRKRATSLSEMVWQQKNIQHGFEVAVEANIPNQLRTNGYESVRYEVGIGLGDNGEIVVRGENLWLLSSKDEKACSSMQRSLFPLEMDDSQPLVHPAGTKTLAGHRVIVRKAYTGNDYFRSERTGWNITFRLSPRRLALSGVPEDQERFPIALWFRETLLRQVQILQLNSKVMRQPCPADAARTFQPDGSNLPIMVDRLKAAYPERFAWWQGHLQTILEDLENITIVERPEDRSRYLVLSYKSGLTIPAWMLSDGTMRLLALTLIAYLPPKERIFLIEEPENGVHPRAIEAVHQAVSSVYEGQIFLATHSPLFMALAKTEQLLVFAKIAESGATDIVRGSDHPVLRKWRSEIPLETLFAAGVLG